MSRMQVMQFGSAHDFSRTANSASDGDVEVAVEVATPSLISCTIDKVSLTAKLQELKKGKEAALAEIAAKFDGDIQALETVLAL